MRDSTAIRIAGPGPFRAVSTACGGAGAATPLAPKEPAFPDA